MTNNQKLTKMFKGKTFSVGPKGRRCTYEIASVKIDKQNNELILIDTEGSKTVMSFDYESLTLELAIKELDNFIDPLE